MALRGAGCGTSGCWMWHFEVVDVAHREVWLYSIERVIVAYREAIAGRAIGWNKGGNEKKNWNFFCFSLAYSYLCRRKGVNSCT